MFDFIRTHQRLMQFVLLVLILPSFVLIGVSGYTNYVSGDHDLVKIGRSAISQQDFDQARRSQLQQMQQNSPGGFDPTVLDTPQARRALLESLIDRRVLIATATKEHFSVSDEALRRAIASMPQLQVNGQFSAERYNEVLTSVGLTTKDFEQSQRAELALDRVLSPVSDTSSVPAPVLAHIEQALTEQRVVRLMAYAAGDYQKDLDITDADIKAWYDENKQKLELPEQVDAQYLLLNEAAAMAAVPAATEQQLRDYYEQNRARYVRPARINVSHILISVPAGATESQRDAAKQKAEDIAKRVQTDKASFAEVARDESQDAGTAKDGGKLGWITKGSWPANLEQAVFALGKGDVSGVVDGPGGFHIFLANDVQPEQSESFDEAKAKVQTEVRRQLAAERFADMATQLTGLVYDNPGSLQAAADKLGLKIHSAAGIARDRLLSADEIGANAAAASEDASLLDDVRVRRALFSPPVLNEKQNSGVIEISPDTMIVVRVDKLIPAHVPEIGQVTAHIRDELVSERSRAAAKRAGEEALASFSKQAKDEVPEGFGSPLTISRLNPQGLDKAALDAAFHASVKDLPTYTGVEGPQGYVVLRIEGAEQGASNDAQLAGLSGELAQAWGRAEQQAFMKGLRVQSKVKMLPEADKAIAGETESRD